VPHLVAFTVPVLFETQGKNMNKRITRTVMAAMAVVGFGASAPSYAQWYVGASIGKSDIKFDNAAQSDQFLDLGFTNPSTVSNSKDTGYRAFGGYQLHKYIAMEAAYVDLGRFSFRTDVTPRGSLAGSTRIDGLELSAVGTLPLGERLGVFARIGAFSAETRTSYTGSGSIETLIGGDNQKKRSTELVYGAGAMYNINKNLSVRGEWSRYEKLGDIYTGGRTDANLYSLGIVYRF
jgi:OmpA-OmpF porin, OOP family